MDVQGNPPPHESKMVWAEQSTAWFLWQARCGIFVGQPHSKFVYSGVVLFLFGTKAVVARHIARARGHFYTLRPVSGSWLEFEETMLTPSPA